MFSKNLRNIRLRQGLSQKQVADCLMVSPQSVSKWEKGEALPSIDYLPKLAEILKCDINAFFAPVPEKSFDFCVLNDFFVLQNEFTDRETKTTDDIVEFVLEHPAFIEETIAFCEKLMEHKTVNTKAVQSMLACSEAEARALIGHLVSEEMLEKQDADDTYFVIKNAVKGFIILLKLNETICEKSLDDSLDFYDTLKRKFSNPNSHICQDPFEIIK